MTFETGFFRRTKGGWVVRVVIDIVMAGGAGIFQLFDMEMVRDRDIIRIQIRRSPLNSKNTRVAADAVWIDVVKFSRKPGMLSSAFKREDIDARHQGMACCMAIGAVKFWMDLRLFPELRTHVVRMASQTELLLGGGIRGEGDGGIKGQYRKNSS